MDLQDHEHNTRDGVHIAALAGAWIALVCGFGGMRSYDGSLSFAPRLAEGLSRLVFNLYFRGRRVRVSITPEAACYQLTAGLPLETTHHGQPLTITSEAPVCRPLPATPRRPRPRQPAGREPTRRQPSPEARRGGPLRGVARG